MFGPLMQSDTEAMHFRCQSEEEVAMVPPASWQILAISFLFISIVYSVKEC